MTEDFVPARITLVGVDSNAGSIMGEVSRGLREAGNPREVIDEYRKEAMSGDYNNLLSVSMSYCENEGFEIYD